MKLTAAQVNRCNKDLLLRFHLRASQRKNLKINNKLRNIMLLKASHLVVTTNRIKLKDLDVDQLKQRANRYNPIKRDISLLRLKWLKKE